MSTYTDTDLREMAKPPSNMRSEIEEALEAVDGIRSLAEATHYRLGLIVREPSPLPAPALTEDAIVAALKADPAMAGRLIIRLPVALTVGERERLYEATHEAVRGYSTAGLIALQSLAVALAAASYRG